MSAAFARRGWTLFLAGRSADETGRVARDLHIRYGKAVHEGVFDALDPASHAAFFAGVLAAAGGELDGVVVAVGLLGDHDRATTDFGHAREIIDVNYVGPVSVLMLGAQHFERRRRGFLAGISSVAGDRGRQSNYVYGSAKGGLSLFLQGLRNRLARQGVRVHTIKPGFVDTEMTYGMPGVPFSADPAVVGEHIVRAIERRRDVIYVPWFWRYVMLAVRLVPERWFKRMRL
jgi:decaprenylphospho-beta-D-erythro-pentofuranosid-2-ulose 2-reductase